MTKQLNLLEKTVLITGGAITVILFIGIIDIISLTVAYLLNEIFTLLN